ncbi:hypothetical protein [Nocardia cerradoensis]|uniref:Uncharacterized protein n=1 Tax=Nocardia cerradoensis TaxID=85688 RepID=A0A231GV81_9NOCA|nr:hypothetical protein [Nocardia cerradoensis]NKY46055.1 hypothetical protein [Nocardia cerradoensis]OXR40529.1 hypothetical protein B7C42_07338 [Nocardia cerradoensis]
MSGIATQLGHRISAAAHSAWALVHHPRREPNTDLAAEHHSTTSDPTGGRGQGEPESPRGLGGMDF